ncbi:NAD(P)(+) transhydrogenase (Re/Si-specific) subunit alpha [Dyella psychrodurans]|uniref:NAD(P)(+) transhydrogenase (Re/Si-specific) subunit alpha n=1 Tax=Dyella psychrodurans TaxID=1927960 RepID=UPI0018F7067E|nr:NAD(P)(+) transhydrogenase (Re/Si-specific) subunit alpha [Dyella psychrodurans]
MSQLKTLESIAVLGEQHAGERRVGLVPSDVRRLGGSLRVLVERGAGLAAGFTDEHYADAGAELVEREAAIAGASVVITVRAPLTVGALRPTSVLISLGAYDDHLATQLVRHSVVHLGLERVPRISRAQTMDVLSSQAAIAGYAAVLEGASHLDVILPMMSTAAGGLKPAKMIALGAGVAGLQAIATARRLGAMTHGFDVRAIAREQVESLGAKFVFPDIDKSNDSAGGYATRQSDVEQAILRRALAPTLIDMQLVITSAQVPSQRAPILIDDEAMQAMLPGSVIVDLAAEAGGNTTRTLPDEIVKFASVTIVGAVHMANRIAGDASRLFSGNVRALLQHLLDSEGRLSLRPDDEITSALLGGRVVASKPIVAEEVPR